MTTAPGRALAVALGLVLAFAGVEVVAGVFAGSLALLADAAHMLSDALALGLALFAARLAQRPATPERSFGGGAPRCWPPSRMRSCSSRSAPGSSGRRSGGSPTRPASWEAGVLAAGVAGLLVNLAAARVLHGAGSGLNVRAAMLHVLADLASSVGVVVAGLVMLATGWAYADPIAAILIGLLVVLSTAGVLRETVGVLLEGAPAGMDAREVGAAIATTEGVVATTTSTSRRSLPASSPVGARSRRGRGRLPCDPARAGGTPARPLRADAHHSPGRACARPDRAHPLTRSST